MVERIQKMRVPTVRIMNEEGGYGGAKRAVGFALRIAKTRVRVSVLTSSNPRG